MNTKVIEIVVTGPTASGKSGLGHAIEKLLRELGYSVASPELDRERREVGTWMVPPKDTVIVIRECNEARRR